jgi:hypothetical protein
MAKSFKLKSGNKPSFKMMGSSPIKQTYGTGLFDATEGITQRTQDFTNLQIEKAKTERDLLLKRAPWSPEVKEKHKEQYESDEMEEFDTGEVDEMGKAIMGKRKVMKDLEEGWDYTAGANLTDPNISRYKSKEEIRQDKKDRKAASKGFESEEGEKYTKEEKYKDRMANLADKYQRARGTGAMGVSFDWKNMLLGGDIASGFKVEPKKDILARKIKKKAAKKTSRELKKTRKTQRRAFKDEQKAYKTYKKKQKKLDVEPKDFDHWKRTLGKKGGGQL